MEIPLRDRSDPGLRVIETMLWLPGSGVTRGGMHMARADRTCAALGFAFDRARAWQRLDAVSAPGPLRLRMTIDRMGEIDLTHQPFDLGSTPENAVVTISPHRLDPEDPFLRIKTTRRQLYDETLRQKPRAVTEILFFNRHDELCEGAFTNVFLSRGGRILTPHAECGLLPGVLRESLLLSGEAQEAVLGIEDLERAERIWIGNSLRGLIPVTLATGAH